MNPFFRHPLALAACIVLAAVLPVLALAAPVLSYGSGSALTAADREASFEANTGLLSSYSEDGLHFTDSSASTDNGGCGYAAALCGDWFSDAFSGNYFGSNGRAGAYIRIGSGADDLKGLELAVSSGYAKVYGRWQTFRDGVQTGTGVFTIEDAFVGGVIGLADAQGFDEVRLFAFNGLAAQNAVAATGFSNPYIDNVAASVLPAPATPALALTALALMGALRRRPR